MLVKTTTTALALAATLAVGAHAQEDAGLPKATGAEELVGTVWQWTHFQDAAEGDEAGSIDVPEPAKYTLVLGANGGADIQADCNRLTWTYELEGSALTFNTVGPGTLAYCGDESLDQRYLERLGNTASYVIADGRLYLNLKADAGNMIFVAAP